MTDSFPAPPELVIEDQVSSGDHDPHSNDTLATVDHDPQSPVPQPSDELQPKSLDKDSVEVFLEAHDAPSVRKRAQYYSYLRTEHAFSREMLDQLDDVPLREVGHRAFTILSREAQRLREASPDDGPPDIRVSRGPSPGGTDVADAQYSPRPRRTAFERAKEARSDRTLSSRERKRLQLEALKEAGDHRKRRVRANV